MDVEDSIPLNNFPTRKQNVLDLIFTTDPLLVADIVTDMPFCLSDHDSLLFSVYSENHVRHSKSENGSYARLAWNRTNWEELGYYYFETDWDKVFTFEQNANTMWDNLTNTLNCGILSHVPVIRLANQAIKTTHNKKNHEFN